MRQRFDGHRRPGHPRADFGPTLLLIVSPIGPVQPASVRQASSADLETLVSLFDGYRQFYGQPCELDRVREFLSERLTQGDSVLFIAEADGRVAVVVHQCRGWILEAAAHGGEIAQAHLQERDEGGDASRVRNETLDLAALCVQMMARVFADRDAQIDAMHTVYPDAGEDYTKQAEG